MPFSTILQQKRMTIHKNSKYTKLNIKFEKIIVLMIQSVKTKDVLLICTK